MEVIIHGRIRRVIVDGDPRYVRYTAGVTHSQWVCRTLRSAVALSSTVGSVEVIIHGRIRSMIVDGDPRSVRYADGVIHS